MNVDEDDKSAPFTTLNVIFPIRLGSVPSTKVPVQLKSIYLSVLSSLSKLKVSSEF